jgi:wobble nucleotide-excising tRNase
MPVQRICRITGHRIFRDFSWPADLEDFKRYNLIYGWNGTGKSTLGRLFRDLERRVPISEGTVIIRIDGHDIDGASFNAASQPIRVFNADFVRDNVFTATNRLSPIYVIGKENIEKREHLEKIRETLGTHQQSLTGLREALAKATKTKEAFCTSQARVIKEALGAHGNRYANYNKRSFTDKVAQLGNVPPSSVVILNDQEKERLLAQARMSLKPSIDITLYEPPDLATLVTDVRLLLQRKVVSKVIGALKADPTVADWIRQGLGLHRSSPTHCRFCDQPMPNERLEELEAHFSKEFAQLMQDIETLSQRLDCQIASARAFAPPKKAEFYDDLVADYDTASAGALRLCAQVASYLADAATLLKKKKLSPFDPIEMPADPQQMDTTGLDAVRHTISSHNKACQEFASRVDKALKKLEESYVGSALSELADLVAAENRAQQAVTVAESQEHTSRDEIQALERDIISHQRPAYELNADLQAYLGHAELKLRVADTGYAIDRKGQAATALSEGERTAIAVLYFLKSLQDRGFDKKEGIVVLDDPVSSLDANALFNAFAYIKDHTKDAKQVILLTHNYGFFRSIRQWFKNLRGKLKREFRIFMLTTTIDDDGRYAVMGEIDPLLEKYESEYHYLFSYVYRIANAPAAKNLEEYLVAPTIARRLLESFLAFRVPQEDSLHSRMEAIPCDETMRSRIYRFVNTHAHKDGIGDMDDDLTILSETQAVLKTVLDFMAFADREHCERMIQCVSGAGAAT